MRGEYERERRAFFHMCYMSIYYDFEIMSSRYVCVYLYAIVSPPNCSQIQTYRIYGINLV